MTITAVILLALKISIALSVFAVGLRATFADATFLLRRPGELVRALLSMNVLMPAIAVALAMAFDLHPAVKIALVAISVSPIPPILPNKALKAGGKMDYTIGLLVAAGIVSIIIVPIAMEVFQRVAGVRLEMRPRALALLILTTIIGPLVFGILVRRVAPAFAERAAKLLGIAASILLVAGVLPILIGSVRPMVSLLGDGTLLSLGVFAALGCIVGHVLGGPRTENRVVLALASASRHPGIAVAIAHANFPEQKLAVFAVLLYLIVSSVVSALYLAWTKRKREHGSFDARHA